MAARVAAIRRFLADSGQDLHAPTDPEHMKIRDEIYHYWGTAWATIGLLETLESQALKSLTRRWVKSTITNQSRLTARVQIERPGLEGTSVTSTNGT